LGTGVNNEVRALAVDGGGNLYAGGSFTAAGGMGASRVAKWNGTAWSALGAGVGSNVWALAVDGSGNLYVGGFFFTAGGVAVSNIARWSGVAWSTPGTGLSNQVAVLVGDGSGQVYAGGEFVTVGDGSKVTAYFGLYNPNVGLSTLSAALAAQVSLYPNPAHQNVLVKLPAALNRQVVTAALLDGQGRVVLQQALPAGLDSHTLSLVNVATGVYVLHLQTTAGVVVKKVIVE
jgi:hypothetical protein